MLNEISNLWFNYFWPSLKGNGPEALVQTVVYAGIGLTLVPVVRKFLRKEVTRAHKIASGEFTEEELRAKEDAEKLFIYVRKLVRKK